jgi:stress-induced morphogen
MKAFQTMTQMPWSVNGFECEICSERFLGKKLLKDHKEVEHSY